jgi:hypothetical protein
VLKRQNGKNLALELPKARILLFIKTALPSGKAVSGEEPTVKQNGGHNKQTILLTIKCFKSLCLKAQTKKAGEIHEYYMSCMDN